MESKLVKEKYIDSINRSISGPRIARRFSNNSKSIASFVHNFIDGPFLEVKNAQEGQTYRVEFRDGNGHLHYSSDLANNMWAKSSIKYYTKWNIKAINEGSCVYDYTLDYSNQRVYKIGRAHV